MRRTVAPCIICAAVSWRPGEGRGRHARCVPQGLSQARRVPGRTSFRTWLYRITINHCHNLQQSWSARHLVTNSDDAIWENATTPTDSPLRVLETKELGQRIQKALDGLSAEYRLLLLLVADEDLSYDEAARLTEQTPDAVRGKLHRARKAFATLFAQTA